MGGRELCRKVRHERVERGGEPDDVGGRPVDPGLGKHVPPGRGQAPEDRAHIAPERRRPRRVRAHRRQRTLERRQERLRRGRQRQRSRERFEGRALGPVGHDVRPVVGREDEEAGRAQIRGPEEGELLAVDCDRAALDADVELGNVGGPQREEAVAVDDTDLGAEPHPRRIPECAHGVAAP